MAARRVDIRAGRWWGRLGPAGYLALAAADDPAAELAARAAELARPAGDDPVAAAAGGRDAALLLAHEQAMARLRSLLAASPRPFADLAAGVFAAADRPGARAGLGALVAGGAAI